VRKVHAGIMQGNRVEVVVGKACSQACMLPDFRIPVFARTIEKNPKLPLPDSLASACVNRL